MSFNRRRVPAPRGVLEILVLGLIMAGCGEEGEAHRVQVHEEGGIRIVVNHEPELAPGAWRLEPDPEREIGQLEGEEAYLFQRVIHAHVDDGGRIVVVDAGVSAIRIYSPGGVHEGSYGRRGQGPGEFQNVIATQWMPGDTIVLTEFPGSRVSFFAGTGEFVRLWTPPALPGPAYYFPEDRYLWVLTPPLASGSDGQVRPVSHVVMGSPSGPGSDTLAVLTGRESVVVTMESGMQNVQVPFAPGAIHTIDPGGRFIYAQQGFEVVLRSVFDRGETRAQISREPDLVSEGDWRRAVAADLERYDRLSFATPAGRRARERGYDLAERPTHKPALEELTVDREGNVWALGFEAEGEIGQAREWYVFDRSGRWITAVAIPSDLQVLSIGPDYLLARWQDELDVQRLRQYRLVKDG